MTCVTDVFPSQVATAHNAFPFKFHAKYHIEVTARALRCRLRIQNTGERVQPIDVGWHPYLHRSGPCVVRLPARGRWEFDKEREPAPTGRILEVGRDDDFREGRLVNTDEHWDDVFTGLLDEAGIASCWVEETTPVPLKKGPPAPTRIRRTVSMIANSGPDSPRTIENVQLFTPPGRNAISIEPLSAPPNAINLLNLKHERANVCELNPEEDVVHEIIIGLETEPA
jgi:galactose mutarotase-like enzyme